MSSLRSLRRKQRRRTTYDLVLDDPTEAESDLEEALAERRLARLRHDKPDHPERAAAEQACRVARAALLEHVCRITFEGIPRHEFEELQSAPENAPTSAQLKEHEADVERAAKAGRDAPAGPTFNPRTLIPALFARCVVPDDGEEPLTAQEWAHELRPDGQWQEAEVSDAFDTCLAAILQPRSVTIPKD